MQSDVAVFGKLHGHGDFVFAGNTSPTVLELREWVEAGVARASTHPSFAAEFDRGIAFAFVYRGKVAEGRCIAGVMTPSRDAVGRRFPLVVGLELPADTYRSFPHLPPLTLGSVLQSYYERVLLGVRAGDLNSLVEALERPGGPSPSSLLDEARAYTEWTQRVTVQEAFSWMIDPFEGSELESVLSFMGSASAPYRGQTNPPTPVALRLPLGAAGGGGAALWIDIVRRVADWSQMVPTCFWSVSSLRSELIVQLGVTPPTTYAELWAPRQDSEHVCDLTSPTQLASAPPATVSVAGESSVFELLCSLSS